jgi:hypothetical protein
VLFEHRCLKFVCIGPGSNGVDGRVTLPNNTILDGSYRIEDVIGSGGFGVTYLAEDINLGNRFALEEYYPFDFGYRDSTMSIKPKSERHKDTFEWGRASFLQEARMLARFRHPGIVRVTRVFEANSTAYMVMEFEEGKMFKNWLKAIGRPPEELDRIATSILDALEMMHGTNFLHRDIAPDNILMRADRTPVFARFRCRAAGRRRDEPDTHSNCEGRLLTARLLLAPADYVWIEDPGYPLTHAQLLVAKVRPHAIPVDRGWASRSTQGASGVRHAFAPISYRGSAVDAKTRGVAGMGAQEWRVHSRGRLHQRVSLFRPTYRFTAGTG